MLKLTRSLSLSPAGYESQTTNDLKLVFPDEGPAQLSLWASSNLLASASTFYRDMLHSGMHESGEVYDGSSSPAPPAKRSASALDESPTGPSSSSASAYARGDPLDDNDSDTEADDIYHRRKATDGELPCAVAAHSTAPFRKVAVTHAKYSTYVALLSWLQTGRIIFAPLSSSIPSPAAKAALLQHSLATSPFAPLPVSPKSMFKLANYLDIPSLAKLALDAFAHLVEVAHAADEVFGPLLVVPEVRARMTGYLKVNKGEFKAQGGFEAVKAKRARGELRGLEDEVIDVLADLA